MRVVVVLLLAGLLIVSADSLAVHEPVFGADEEPLFEELEVPHISGAPEPTIGIPWDSDSVFYHAGSTTIRARFGEDGEADWSDVTPFYQVPVNVDPMLHVHADSGRIFAGGLHGPCSIMMYSDDDGETWLPTVNMCSGARFDHQSIGTGPATFPATTTSFQGYYCGQLGTIACATSLDGGITWAPFQEVPGPCGGFHGHIRSDPVSGFVAVPVPGCGDELGFISTADGGLSWASHQIPGTEEWTNGFDPSLQFTRESGWLYYGMASEHGIHVGLSKDHGASWEPIGGGMDNESEWLDIGRFHDPPVVAGTFADVQAGDDGRVAMAFLGLEGGPDADLEFLGSNGIYQCDERQDELVWHYYAAFSYDAGDTWDVIKLTSDPVQVGGVYDSVVDGSGGCRNLLDFNDMAIDSMGRVHIAWADGCVDECAASEEPGSEGHRTQVGKLFRQTGGRGLFAAADVASDENDTLPDPAPQQESTPMVGAALVLMGLAVLVRSRRR